MSRHKMRPVSPGEVLREQLEEIDMSASALAARLKVPPNRITTILNEERSVSPDTALRLGRFFGTTPEFWLGLQQAYDLRKAELEMSDDVAAIVPRKAS
jgi:antitoxin HigA-1